MNETIVPGNSAVSDGLSDYVGEASAFKTSVPDYETKTHGLVMDTALDMLTAGGWNTIQANTDLRNRLKELAYNEDSLNNARAFELYRDSTKYQRAVKDLEAAGLNKWLAVNNGISAGSSGAVSSAKATSSPEQEKNAIGMILKLIGTIIAS